MPVVVCATRKENLQHMRLFEFVLSKCNAYPLTIVVDFEKAVHQAIKHVIGDEVIIQGCFYHLTQSTWRNIQHLGMSDMYKQVNEFRLFCGQLDALALLPVDEVPAGMTYLRTIAPPAAADVIEYFDTTYVSGTYRQSRTAASRASTTVALRQ